MNPDTPKTSPDITQSLLSAPVPPPSLRDFAMRARASKMTPIEIEGHIFFLRPMKVKKRAEMMAMLQSIDDDAERLQKTQVAALIASVCGEDGKLLFSDADRAYIEEVDTGSPLDRLGLAAMKAMNIGDMVDEEKKS